jgi:hypothetical protein
MSEAAHMPTPSPESLDFEVLPPRRPMRDVPDLSRLLAWLLDDLIPIPGTKVRIGLDPIIGLIPGFGDGSTALASSLIILHALRAGVPRIVLVRMALNVLVNTAIGAIPGVGDVFSAFFKSNRRNVALLERHAGARGVRASTVGDWIFVGALVGGLLLVAVAVSFAVGFVVYKLFKLLIAA